MLQRKRKQNKGMVPQFLSILDTGYLRAVDFFMKGGRTMNVGLHDNLHKTN